jgi:predicted dehydrogenase
VQRERPQAAVICTPPATHAPIAATLLAAGVDVLCEKPLALDAGEAAAMLGAAARGRALLMMASKFRYVEDVIKAKSMIEGGLLGEVVLFENVFCGRVDMRSRWNAQRAIAGGGVLADNGTHSVDIARYLLGPIVAVQAQAGRSVQGLEVEDSALLQFRTAAGAMGSVQLSWSIAKQGDYLAVHGTEGALSVGWQASRYQQGDKPWVAFGDGYQKVAAMRGQMRNFLDARAGRVRPIITAADALESVRVIEAGYRSLGVDKWVAVEADHALAA